MQSSEPYRTDSSSEPQANAAADANRCPFLGTLGDPNTSLDFASATHRCFTTHFPVPVSSVHQENYCLSSNHTACPVYQRQANRASAPAVPLAPRGAVGAGLLEWPEDSQTAEPVAAIALAPVAAPVTAPAPAPRNGLKFNWDESAHPDFQNDMQVAMTRRPARQLNARPVIYGLLLLALIPIGWWLWSNVGAGSRNTSDVVQGSIVTMPTLRASSSAAEGSSYDGGSLAGIPPQTDVGDATPPADGSSAAGAPAASATPAATNTPTDLERIAATATALFANATPIVECVAPSWWVSYVVEEGDTIEALAAARGMLPEEVIVPNCLAGPELQPGMVLLLPPVGVIAVGTERATVSPSSTASPTRPTRSPISPTRGPSIIPTIGPPTVIIITTPNVLVPDPPDDPPGPGPRPPGVPTSSALSTATPPPVYTQTPVTTSTPPPPETATPPPVETATPTRGLPTWTPPPTVHP